MRNLLVAALVLVSCNTIAAGVYRWTDASGQVHFSNQPPANMDSAERININAGTSQTATQPAPLNTEAKVEAKNDKPAPTSKPLTRSEKAEKKALTEQKAANCRNAKANLENLNLNHSIRFTLPDGSVRPLTEAERAERVKSNEDAVKEYCQ